MKGFFPDFILWIKRAKKQRIVFVKLLACPSDGAFRALRRFL